jgi:DNA repair exonuclease SbcCD nuclease subunit
MNTGLFFNSQMRVLERAGISVYLKRGNHDAASEVTRALTLPGNVHVFDADRPQTIRRDDLRVALHGRSFSERATPNDLAATYPDPVPGFFNIGVLHTSLAGYAAHDPYAPTSLDILRSRGYDYWALGHVHAREVLQAEYPRIIYCGNPQGRHAGETGAKGCELVSVEGGELQSDSVALDVVRWAVIDLPIDGFTDMAHWRRSAQALMREAHDAAAGRLSAWRLQIVGSGSLHERLASRIDDVGADLRQLADAASGGLAWVEKIRVRSRASTRSFVGSQVAMSDDDPLLACLRLSQALQSETQGLKTFAQDALNDVLVRLPSSLRIGPQSIGFDDADMLAALVREAEAMLLDRLGDVAS